jgi:diguanylate cyclase (GGDEF)-like protein/PAS domain S-box-containing protein
MVDSQGDGDPLAAQDPSAIGGAAGGHDRRALEAERDRFALLADNATDVVWEGDSSGTIVWISSGVRDALGWEPDALVGKPSLELLHADDQMPTAALLKAALVDGQANLAHVRFRTAAGGYRWMSARHQPVRDRNGVPTGLVVGLRDVHEEHAMREQLAFLAFHDPLTGLRNRAWILDMLETDLAVARRDHCEVAVLFLDLDNFKVINDSLGHLAGDHVLAATAHRISKALRPGDRVGRFGGDEFIVILPDIRHPHHVDVIAERLCDAVVDEVEVGDRSVIVSASVGIAISNPDSTPMHLLRDADAAMYEAKSAGPSGWKFADPAAHSQAMSRLDLEAELRTAVAQRQFVVHYQPIVSIADDSVVGLEALVRWQHPERGLLAPLEFLQVAEDTDLILGIEDQVLDQVCEYLTQRSDLTGRVSLNKSPVHIARPGWHDRLLDRLDVHHVDPSRIVIEVTETAILSVLDRTRADLIDLRERGVGIHIDDFGTGYSSIALLRDLPVTGLKLDLSFTRDITTDATARALAAGLAGLAQGLGLESVAEGIETREQAAILREQGWRNGQGYLYGRPALTPSPN